MFFKDRTDAGLQLAALLMQYKGNPDVIVLGLARGGVVVAHAIAEQLHVDLNVLVIRKLGAPMNPELALGAIGEDGAGVYNERLIAMLGVSPAYLESECARQKILIQERLQLYRKNRPSPALKGKIVIVVDDGIATGASIRAAIRSVRSKGPQKIVLAVPVAAPDSLRVIAPEVYSVVCPFAPDSFEAVGSFYEEFGQTSDEEVIHFCRRDFHS